MNELNNLISLSIKMDAPIGFLQGNNISKASQSKIRKAYNIKRLSKNNPNPIVDVAVSLGFEATGNNRLRKAFAYLAEDYNNQVEEIKLNAKKAKEKAKKMKIKIKKKLKIKQEIAKQELKRKLKRLVSTKRNIQVSADISFKGWYKPKNTENFEKKHPNILNNQNSLANFNEAQLTELFGEPYEYDETVNGIITNTNSEKLKFIKEIFDENKLTSPFVVHHTKLQNVSFNQTPSKRVYVNNIRVKRNGVLKLGGEMYNCPPEWCKDRDMCFPDYIQYVLQKAKGRKKKITDEKIQELSLINYQSEVDETLDKNPNENGYSVEHMMNYAYQVKASIYILIDGVVIKENKHPNTSDAVALVFEIKNSHLYPITNDKYIREIRCKKTSHLNSNTFEEHKQEDKKDNEEKKYDNVYETGGGGISNIINSIVEIGKQPSGYNLKISNGIVLPLKIDNDIYLTQKTDNVVKNYCDKKNIQYVGQSATLFAKEYLSEFIKENYSYPAKDVEEALNMDNVKNRTHLGLIRDNENSMLFKEGKLEDCICVDINKCYRYSMENPLECWATIDYSHFVKYTDKYMGFGLYFLETNDTTLMTGNNWYSSGMLLKCDKENIDYKIKAFIKCNEKPKDIFIKLINQIESDFDDIALIKTIINNIYGWCSKTKSTRQNLCIDTDINVAFNDYAKWEALKNQTPYIRKFNPIADENTTYYAYGNKYDIIQKVNNLPMAIQIQDNANIQLYDMVKKTGGEVLYRKTDCAVIYNPKNELILSNKIGGYSKEVFPNKSKLKLETSKYLRDVKLIKRKYWEQHTFPTSDSYKEIINIILDKGGGMLDAEAGLGKTFIAQQFIKECEERGLKYKALAFTNKATTHLKGMTIDSYFRKNKNGKLDRKWLYEISNNIDVIIVDEISMVSGENWKILQEFKEQTGCIVMLLGHSWQLPPVENNKINWFNHSCMKYLANYNKIDIEDLSSKSRYDRNMREFVRDVYLNDEWNEETKKIMNNVKKVNINDMINADNIAYTNKTRKEINRRVQNELIKNNQSVYIEYNGDADNYSQNAYIFNGAKLLLHHTSKDKIFKKNETAFIKELKEASFIIEKDEIDYEFIYENFHKEFLLGYATTIHKSQGDSLRGEVNIFDTKLMNEWLKDKRCIYTALTRATAIDKIHICKM
mgnify:FL=1